MACDHEFKRRDKKARDDEAVHGCHHCATCRKSSQNATSATMQSQWWQRMGLPRDCKCLSDATGEDACEPISAPQKQL
ncbi:hypothetical protein V9T40_011181 [Parthenolecanium corni]|uniref:Uncharacterized protein n=1 Tax=Parthenolecanium corni TaxID=536013 RepID=A0AAN9T5K5_9HEMI